MLLCIWFPWAPRVLTLTEVKRRSGRGRRTRCVASVGEWKRVFGDYRRYCHNEVVVVVVIYHDGRSREGPRHCGCHDRVIGGSNKSEIERFQMFESAHATILFNVWFETHFMILYPVGNSSVNVRFISTKWANGSFLFDYMGQWELLI